MQKNRDKIFMRETDFQEDLADAFQDLLLGGNSNESEEEGDEDDSDEE
jgi:hypothetical protein